MVTMKKILGVGVGLALAVSTGASMWFWFTPVGLTNYLNKVTIELARRSPQELTQIGLVDDTLLDFHSGKLDDYTEAFEAETLERTRKARAGLDHYGPQGLDGKELLTWHIAAWHFDNILRQAKFKHGGYRVNQLSGVTVELPQFLTDSHVIQSRRSAQRYLQRLHEFGRVLREVKVRVEDDRAHGVVPPDFTLDKTLVGMRAFLEGGSAKNPLVTTLPDRLKNVPAMSDRERAQIVAEATDLVEREVLPGFRAMTALFEDMRGAATHDAGIWRIPNGDAIYAEALRSNTTTEMTAEQIHTVGLAEVARIEKEMLAILDAQHIEGATLAERLHQLNTRPDQLFSDDDAGRAKMLDYLKSIHEKVMTAAPYFFITVPPQPLEIVRVPVYAQDSSPGGYYNSPALDGSRPGRFYINQKSTADNPKYSLVTLMIHEGAPGHHFQNAAAQLIKDVPLLRKVINFSAYSEGWALYVERMAKTDMGIYDADPLGDLGRLQAEMFRAVRLVVDSGMHAKRWTREQAIAFMLAKTGMPEPEVVREIERYVVWPGQATAYKVGQLAMLRARERAERELGSRFDLKAFHELVLMNGEMPLSVLDDAVDRWIATIRSKP
jgi:uncharacterized protein (DUF885 family)